MTDSSNDIGAPLAARHFQEEEHVSELWYTTDDDGIWVICLKHNWEMSLGFCPSITTAAEAWAQHVIDINTPREQR